MLKKIRQALLIKQDHPHKDFEDSPLYKDEEESLDVTFARELTKVEGQFIYCDGEIAVIENLILLAEKLRINKIHAWEPGIQQLLVQYGFPIYMGEHHFDDTDAGITGCESLIARNGSVLISNGDLAGRRLSIYPPIHIVVAKASQLVIDIRHGLQRLHDKYAGQLPSMISTITGPSRTADIEKDLVLGAHGPKQLYVFLLEDRF